MAHTGTHSPGVGRSHSGSFLVPGSELKHTHTHPLRRGQPLHRLYVKTIPSTACQKQQRNQEALTAEKKERAKNTALGPAKADRGGNG